MNREIKITEKDLIGDIADFPVEIVRKMVEEQMRQGNNADVCMFQKCANKNKNQGGFDWRNTEDGHIFWELVIYNKNFGIFFEKYPKQDSTKIQGTENTTPQPHKEIDWETRRYEIAKYAMNGILTSAVMYDGCHQSSDVVSRMSVRYADDLIAELKKGK